MELEILALHIFRQLWGVAADPESSPEKWAQARGLAAEQIREEHLGWPEEGGEA